MRIAHSVFFRFLFSILSRFGRGSLFFGFHWRRDESGFGILWRGDESRLYRVLGLVFVLGMLPDLVGQNLPAERLHSARYWKQFDQVERMERAEFWEAGFVPLAPHESIENQQQHADALGFTHHQFQLYYHQYPVEHAVFYLHERNGQIESANGFLPSLKQALDFQPISESKALKQALHVVNAQQYLWEIPYFEQLLKDIEQDTTATYYPSGALMWVDEDFDWESPNYRLAYKFEILTAEPHGNQLVYIDAQNGLLLKQMANLCEINAPATAETKFSGTRPIMTDFDGSSYRLRDYSRASGGIETLDMNNMTNLNNAVDFTDSDTIWDNFNANWDEVATDVHWGMERTYDYFFHEHGRDSYDGNGAKIPSFVHLGPKSSSTAFWNVNYAGFGDNNGLPHAGPDVVGHEFTHGMIRNAAGNLIYFDEGGSLNEGYADIFGNCVQYFADSANFSWQVGEASGAFRSMSNPSSFTYITPNQVGSYPDTYKGNGWYEGDWDNGGAHLNSTVFSHWFYLLSEGGSGTNDLGNAYAVNGIGIEKAALIAYRMLTVYLTPTAQFEDAWKASIQATVDTFGICSPEYISNVNAWYAIGFGKPMQDMDLEIVEVLPFSNCGLSSAESIQILIRNNGCQTIPAGTSLLLTYFVSEPFQNQVDQVQLSDSLTGGEEMIYTFANPADLSALGDIEVHALMVFTDDPETANNTSPTLIVANRNSVELQIIDFEGNSAELMDTLQMFSGSESQMNISIGTGNAQSTGLLIEGASNGSDYRFVNGFPHWGGPTPNIFDYNPTFSSSVCFCVDAQNLNQLMLSFDRKQHFSTYYSFAFNDSDFPVTDSLISANVNVLRLQVDGTEIDRYQAISKESDPWETHQLDLSAYAGSQFQLCFEGKTVLSQADDPQGIGDRIFLDNIQLAGTFTGINPGLPPGYSFHVFPNPIVHDRFQIEVEIPASMEVEFRMRDVLGRSLWHRKAQLLAGKHQLKASSEGLADGIYILEMITDKGRLSQKLEIR